MIKQLILSISFCMLFLSSISQTYQSHFSLEHPTQDPYVQKYDMLPNGNTVITMNIDTSVFFNPGNINLYQETSTKNPGSIVTCVSPSNNVVWTKQWIPVNYLNDFVYVYQAVHDASGNVYLGARYSGKVDIDPSVNVQFLQPVDTNSVEACIIKLDMNGQFIWAKKIGEMSGYNSIYLHQIQILANGNLSIVGEFGGSFDFDPSTSSHIMSTTNSFTNNGYVLELTTSGNFVSVQQMKGNYCAVYKMLVDNTNAKYLLYHYYDTLQLSLTNTINLRLGNTFIGSYGLAKFDASNNFVWSKEIDLNIIPIKMVEIDASTFYLLSNYSSTAILNNGNSVTSVGPSDICIDKWGSSGTCLSTQTIVGKGGNDALDLKLWNGKALLLYNNDDSVSFTTGTPSIIYSANYDMVLSTFDSSWNHLNSAVFRTDSSSYTLQSEMIMNGNDLLFKMYAKGSSDLDPSASTVNFTPAYTTNFPAVFVRVGMNVVSQLNENYKDELLIYPNPTTGVLYFSNQEEDFTVEVFDMNGRVMMKMNTTSKTNFIDLKQLPQGNYLISLSNKNGTKSCLINKLEK